MFYDFNNFTGRLKNSSNMQPLFPLRPVPLAKGEPPKIIYDTVKTQAATTSGNNTVRAASSSAPSAPSSEPWNQPTSAKSLKTLPPALVAKMIKYQADFEKPVYLVNGTPDKILFGITCALGVIGIGMIIDFVIREAPKK